MAAAAGTAPAKGTSLIVQLGVLVALSLAAIGAGWFAGGIMGADGGHEAAAGGGQDHVRPAGEPGAGEAEALSLYPLATITTNLADARDIWVRLEVALVFKDRADARIAELVHQDLLAYLRTVKSRQIEGPSGFKHLKTDLEERAQMRSEGRVVQVLVRTLLFE